MFKKTNLKAVLFDFGDTLFAPLSSEHERRNLLVVSRQVDSPLSDEDFVVGFLKFKKETTSAFKKHSFFRHEEMIAASLRGFLLEQKLSFSGDIVQKYCRAQREAVVNFLKPRNDCIPTLIRLRQLGFQLAIVSNIDNSWMEPIVEKFGLSDWFNLIMTSETARSCKPHHGIFEKTIKQLNRTVNECLFVGDSEINDVHGAQRLGMQVIRFQTEDTSAVSHANLTITSLSQIPDSLF